MTAGHPISEAIDALRHHHFVGKIEWLLDIPASTLEYRFPPESGKSPSIKFQFNVAPETVKTCEEVATLVHRTRNLLHTLQKLDFISSTLETIDFTNNIKEGAEDFEFQIQNYYLRITTVLDQVYELVSVLCEIELVHANPRRFERLVSQREPDLGQILSEFRIFTRPAKKTRNFAAHLAEFADDEYNIIAHFLQHSSIVFSSMPILECLETYKKMFIPQCKAFLSEMVIFVSKVFDALLPIASARYREETTPRGTIELRRATPLEEASARRRFRHPATD